VARLAVLLASFVALVVASFWTLHHRQPEVVGYNGARPFAFLATVAPGRPVCTGLGQGRTEPDRVQVTVGSNGAGPQPLRLSLPGAGVGATVRSYRDGVVDLPLPAHPEAGNGVACLENLGTRPVLAAGEPGSGSSIRNRPQKYTVAYALVDRTPPRWSASADDVLHDVGLARAGAGGAATGYVVLVLLGLSLIGALAATARWVR